MALRHSLPIAVGLLALACGQVTSGTDENASPEAVADEGQDRREDINSTEVPAQSAAQASRLCNGSAEVRFLYVTGGGFIAVPFRHRNGSQFLAIDGHCRYWLGGASLVGLRGGELDPGRAEAFARDLQYGQYASVASYEPQVCSDCGSTILVDDTGMLGRAEETSDGPAPPVWSAAMRAAVDVVAELREEALPVAVASKTLLVLRTERSDVLGVAPLDLESRALDADSTELFDDRPEHWLVVDDAPTLELLAELQQTAWRANAAARSIFVEDVQGRHYEVLVRDEPPAAVAAALDDALLRDLP